MRFAHLEAEPWADYELIDSGENTKLERFGTFILARPETEALWAKARPEEWQHAIAEFKFEDGKGKWHTKGPVPESWQVAWGATKARLQLTSFKHTGIFPEQAPNWTWISKRVSSLQQLPAKKSSDLLPSVGQTVFSEAPVAPRVLNLFGYTGLASIMAAQAGAHVTHVDASKQSLDWAHENARLSGLGEDKIRWMLDDALAFAKREVRRGVKYDGIILDPPAFGRGAKGEVWHIEDQLPELLATLKELLSDASGSFFLMSGYAAGYSPLSFAQAVESVFGALDGEAGELRIKESESTRAVPAGIYVRFVR